MIGHACESRVVTTGKDIVNYIIENGLYDALVGIGVEGLIDDTEINVGYDGELLLFFDSNYYEGYCD